MKNCIYGNHDNTRRFEDYKDLLGERFTHSGSLKLNRLFNFLGKYDPYHDQTFWQRNHIKQMTQTILTY